MTGFRLNTLSPFVPKTQPKANPQPCKRSCCWTPFGHKVDAPKTCQCHTPKESLYS